MTPPDAAFLRPIAHRGLHDASRQVVENTAPAFQAAIAKGYGIECDIRPAAGGLPVVFHDEKLDRLVDDKRRLDELRPEHVRALRYRGQDTPIATLSDLLALAAGRVPLLVEIKSTWAAPDAAFLDTIARDISAYDGPVALMSFDPDVLAGMKERSPGIPRGLVAAAYSARHWHSPFVDEARAARLRDLLDWRVADPCFVAYDVRAMPSALTRFVREGLGVPLFAWTVRTPRERAKAARFADAAIFEGFEP